MAKTVNVYVKRKIQLGNLTVKQREMWALGNAALASIKTRVGRAIGPDDQPAPPLKHSFRIKRDKDGNIIDKIPLGYSRWGRIKKSRGLKPIRDLHGTGTMSTYQIASFRGRTLKKRSRIKNVGHLMDQLTVRKVGDNKAVITEPTTDAGRMKARGNRSMLGFSPFNTQEIVKAAKLLLSDIKNKLIRVQG